jgi:hypothetical protein
VSGKAILLHPNDNILVVIAPIFAGERVDIDGNEIVVAQDVNVGHKLARRPLTPGDKVLKYGAPIGSMIKPVAAGEWVHMHNLKSDYIASHTRETAREGGGS